MKSFTFATTKSIICGPGTSAALSEHAGSLLGARILLVTDPGILKLGLIETTVTNLRASGHEVIVFHEVEADPSVATVQAATAMARSAEISGVIGFGGGSSLDVAKVVALMLGSDQPLDDAWGVGNACGPRLPLVLIPTTAGTGSEVTPIAILTVSGDEKRGISSPVLLPDLAVLDAELTSGLPAPITAATGIDAMVHAIEAYASANTNNNPVSRALAREALRLLGAHIETAVHDGKNAAAREAMLLGSMLAGQAFANSPVAAVHALAYPIGGIFHIPHGLSNAMVLTAVLRFNLAEAGALYAEIAADVFPLLAQIPQHHRAARFLQELDALCARLNLPPRLRDIGIGEADLPRLASEAMKQQRLLVNNPRPVLEADALSIYREAW